MKTAKLGAIFVISVMALAGTGAAYALWYDYLHLDIDIETGYIGAEWSFEYAEDSEIEGKDYSYVEVELLPWNDNANARMFVHMYNVYPCIDYTVFFNIENTGTIPIHIAGPFPYLYENKLTGADGWGTIQFFDLAGYPIIREQLQIHPEEPFFGYFTIHFNNNLPQDITEWVYCMEFAYHQYNEPYTPPIN